MAKILLVDDELVIRDVVGRMLEEAGHKVWRMTTARDARALLASPDRVDAAIIDLVLLDSSGLDLIKHARESRPSMPIIVISGYLGPGSTEIRATLTSLGVRHALAKPIEKQALLDAVARATAG